MNKKDKNRKIAILDMDNPNNPFWGSGQAKVTLEVGKRLSKKFDITVYCSRYPNSKDYQLGNLKYKHVSLGSRFSKLNNVAYLLTLPLLVRKLKEDVIIENFTAPISTCFTPLFTKRPVIGLTSFFAADKLSEKYHLPFKIIEKMGIGLYKYIITLNKGDYNRALKLNPKALITEIPNGVDDHYFNLSTTEKNYFLFLGRIDIHQKGLDLLIQSFSKVYMNIKDNLYIAGTGTGQDEKNLIEMIKKYKLDKRVHLLGRIGGNKKDEIIANTKFFVFSSRYEGQSLSALESIACGKPIICFDIPGFNWLDDSSCIKVKQFDIDSYAKALQELSSNQKKRLNLGSKAKKFASKYSWDSTSQLYSKFISNIIQ